MIVYGTLTTTYYDNMFWMIKEAMQYGTNGVKVGGIAAWTVVGSSNSVNFNMAGTDLLVAPANIVQATGNHSWIVLQQPLQGAAPGYLQVCFDWNSASGGSMSMAFSVSAGFTVGAINARPTATDEVVMFTAGAVFGGTTSTGSCGVNCLKSTDGKSTRIVVTRDGALETRGFWMFDELIDIESYWISKSIVCATSLTHAMLSGGANIFNYQGGSHSGRLTWAGMTSYVLSEQFAVPTMHRPSYGGEWPVFKVGFCNTVGTNKGWLGSVADMWAAPYTMPTGQYLGSSLGGEFQYVNIGGLVFPWTGEPLALP
jgi:hypothetical protein